MFANKKLAAACLVALTSAPKSRVAAFVATAHKRSLHVTAPLRMAGPGVELAPIEELKKALANPEAVVVDIRGVQEIAETGVWKTNTRWANAPGSPQENPLLSVAAEAIIPDKKTPVIVHCAKGFRAVKAKEILESQGYENVLNAGGYPEDMTDL